MKKQLRGISAKNKYLEFMLKLHSLHTFNRRQIESEYRISHAVCSHLSKRGYITQEEKDQWRWIGNAPTMILVDSIRGSIYLDQKQCKEEKKKRVTQLTINSIKNPQHQARAQAIIDEAKRIVAERTQSVPAKDEPIHDTSNSKMLLILAAGALLGFMIATLIWK